ncbi:hypothetical protein BN1708_008760 [Verticillium longisporum]|uniref:Oxidoreductase n=1 Tax=Verticillium longisporum TaxID=100787 RepID=A0A0G4N7X7_VERLO|nr:hypothetical protein BN1708_008760 [Verticillium longisporum]
MSEQFKPGHEVPVTDQSFPGKEGDMPHPTPKFDKIPTADGGEKLYQAAGKLKDKKAIITGGDSGIGRASAILFAMEGADTLIAYLPNEEDDAQETKKRVEDYGRRCYLLATDKNFTSPMGRPAQPSEIATCVVFLASTDSSALSGQVIHCNGGVIVNG